MVGGQAAWQQSPVRRALPLSTAWAAPFRSLLALCIVIILWVLSPLEGKNLAQYLGTLGGRNKCPCTLGAAETEDRPACSFSQEAGASPERREPGLGGTGDGEHPGAPSRSREHSCTGLNADPAQPAPWSRATAPRWAVPPSKCGALWLPVPSWEAHRDGVRSERGPSEDHDFLWFP